MAQVLTREFDCLTCHKPIKLSKMDNAGPNARKKWERFELDGLTPHQCKKKEEGVETGVAVSPTTTTTTATSVPQVENGQSSQIAELTKKVSDLKIIVNSLIAEIQMLRSDVKSRNGNIAKV